jgi:GntR family transcriptional repressor for pyruvate dehydrogenase complex
MVLRVIQSRSLGDQVFEQLGEEILSGRYPAGTNLPAERALVVTFKVNRHVVREALKRLEQLGLIKVSQGGGTKVLDFEHHAGLDLLAMLAEHAAASDNALTQWRAVHEMRAAIGSDTARLCALRGSPALKEEILGIARKMKELGNRPELFDLELEFWDKLLTGAGNIAYRLSFNTLIKAVTSSSVKELAKGLSVQEVVASDFRLPIATAVATGDGALAEAKTRESLHQIVEVLNAQVTASSHVKPPSQSPTSTPAERKPKAVATATAKKRR